jgi:uncharacterized membrane protein YgdD (TMEM256/DUF423 family)
MTKKFLITVGILGVLSVILGAFGSHLLNGKISEENMRVYNIALTYQIYHTLALLAMTFMNRYISRKYLNIIYWLFVVGIGLFSGSLFLISTQEATNLVIGAVGYLTPLGGISMIAGWLVVIFTGVTYQHKKRAIHSD